MTVDRTAHAADLAADSALHVKGSPEQVIERCVNVDAAATLAEAARLESRGWRLIAVARGREPGAAATADEAERRLHLLGLVALEDPPRPGVADAVVSCRCAGSGWRWSPATRRQQRRRSRSGWGSVAWSLSPFLLAAASGATFGAVVLGQVANAFTCRTETVPGFLNNPRANPLLLGAVLVELALLPVCLVVRLPRRSERISHRCPVGSSPDWRPRRSFLPTRSRSERADVAAAGLLRTNPGRTDMPAGGCSGSPSTS